MQQRAVQSVENVAVQRQLMDRQAGLADRDYIPLAIAVFVDFCLLLVSMTRPMHGFRSLEKKMFEAEEWPIIQILARFKDIHSDEDVRETFDVFRHVVFDYMGDYYVGVPLRAPANSPNLEDAQREAHLLSNLFTSFEKEGVFKRVLWPNNSIARSRLEKQDSKFAGSEDFRIYRFRDGAWSDWVLGAVMGAAKRVETEKQRQKLEEQLYPKTEQPAFETAPQTAAAYADQPYAQQQSQPNLNEGTNMGRNPSAQNAGYAFDRTGYTNVEPIRPTHANVSRPADDQFARNTSHQNGAPFSGQHNNGTQTAAHDDIQADIRANGTDGGLNQRLNGQFAPTATNPNGAAKYVETPNTTDTTDVHTLWTDEPVNTQSEVIQLADASAYLNSAQNEQQIETPTEVIPMNGPNGNNMQRTDVQTQQSSNADGTIRLRRETVEIDSQAVNAINANTNGGDFMSALTDALNPGAEDAPRQAAIEEIKTPVMPIIETVVETQTPEAKTQPIEAYIDANPVTDYAPAPATPVMTDYSANTADHYPVTYEEAWEDDGEEEFQIENITRWYGRQDNDSKPN